jgi:hypothetical protein
MVSSVVCWLVEDIDKEHDPISLLFAVDKEFNTFHGLEKR